MRACSVLLSALMLAVPLALAAPSAVALPAGLVFVVDDAASGHRCYAYEGAGAFELWIETNGRTTGGEPTLTGQGSGLQRASTVALRADTRVSQPATWASRCTPHASAPPLPSPPSPPCTPFPACVVPDPGDVPQPCTLAPSAPVVCAPLGPAPEACELAPATPILCASLGAIPDRCDLFPDTCCDSGPLDTGGDDVPCEVALLLDQVSCVLQNGAVNAFACLGQEPPVQPCQPAPSCALPPPPCSPTPQCLVPPGDPGPCPELFVCNLPAGLLRYVECVAETADVNCVESMPCSPFPTCATPPRPPACVPTSGTCQCAVYEWLTGEPKNCPD